MKGKQGGFCGDKDVPSIRRPAIAIVIAWEHMPTPTPNTEFLAAVIQHDDF